jgi:hypothetical protein
MLQIAYTPLHKQLLQWLTLNYNPSLLMVAYNDNYCNLRHIYELLGGSAPITEDDNE